MAQKIPKPERKVALIPSVVLSQFRYNECGLLLTNRRSMFIEERHIPLGWALLGVVPFMVGRAVFERTPVPYSDLDIPTLTARAYLVIQHTAIEQIGVRRRIGGYALEISYRLEKGSVFSLIGSLAPPPEFLQARKGSGMSASEARRGYAQQAWEAYAEALPAAPRNTLGPRP